MHRLIKIHLEACRARRIVLERLQQDADLVDLEVDHEQIDRWFERVTSALTEEQRREIANFILQVKDHPHRWIYTGLEGSFRIIDKPKDALNGIYVLTANYTSKSGAEGKSSLLLKIK